MQSPVDITDPRFTHINQQLVEIKSSPTGWGWFARQDIANGEWVWRNTFNARDVQTLTSKDLAGLEEHERHALFQFAEDEYEIVPKDDPNYYQNHSCDPTTWFQGDDLLVTSREVKAGEELTCDYSTFDSNYPWDIIPQCCCGSSLCRGVVSCNDWKLPSLQERYKGHFLAYLQQKIDKL